MSRRTKKVIASSTASTLADPWWKEKLDEALKSLAQLNLPKVVTAASKPKHWCPVLRMLNFDEEKCDENEFPLIDKEQHYSLYHPNGRVLAVLTSSYEKLAALGYFTAKPYFIADKSTKQTAVSPAAAAGVSVSARGLAMEIDLLNKHLELQPWPKVILESLRGCHMINELVQNAYDVDARNITFDYSRLRLIFSHDSEIKFSLRELRALCLLSASTKNQYQSAGQYGVGFKTLFLFASALKVRLTSGDIDCDISYDLARSRFSIQQHTAVPSDTEASTNAAETRFYFELNQVPGSVDGILDELADYKTGQTFAMLTTLKPTLRSLVIKIDSKVVRGHEAGANDMYWSVKTREKTPGSDSHSSLILECKASIERGKPEAFEFDTFSFLNYDIGKGVGDDIVFVVQRNPIAPTPGQFHCHLPLRSSAFPLGNNVRIHSLKVQHKVDRADVHDYDELQRPLAKLYVRVLGSLMNRCTTPLARIKPLIPHLPVGAEHPHAFAVFTDQFLASFTATWVSLPTELRSPLFLKKGASKEDFISDSSPLGHLLLEMGVPYSPKPGSKGVPFNGASFQRTVDPSGKKPLPNFAWEPAGLQAFKDFIAAAPIRNARAALNELKRQDHAHLLRTGASAKPTAVLMGLQSAFWLPDTNSSIPTSKLLHLPGAKDSLLDALVGKLSPSHLCGVALPESLAVLNDLPKEDQEQHLRALVGSLRTFDNDPVLNTLMPLVYRHACKVAPAQLSNLLQHVWLPKLSKWVELHRVSLRGDHDFSLANNYDIQELLTAAVGIPQQLIPPQLLTNYVYQNPGKFNSPADIQAFLQLWELSGLIASIKTDPRRVVLPVVDPTKEKGNRVHFADATKLFELHSSGNLHIGNRAECKLFAARQSCYIHPGAYDLVARLRPELAFGTPCPQAASVKIDSTSSPKLQIIWRHLTQNNIPSSVVDEWRYFKNNDKLPPVLPTTTPEGGYVVYVRQTDKGSIAALGQVSAFIAGLLGVPSKDIVNKMHHALQFDEGGDICEALGDAAPKLNPAGQPPPPAAPQAQPQPHIQPPAASQAAIPPLAPGAKVEPAQPQNPLGCALFPYDCFRGWSLTLWTAPALPEAHGNGETKKRKANEEAKGTPPAKRQKGNECLWLNDPTKRPTLAEGVVGAPGVKLEIPKRQTSRTLTTENLLEKEARATQTGHNGELLVYYRLCNLNEGTGRTVTKPSFTCKDHDLLVVQNGVAVEYHEVKPITNPAHSHIDISCGETERAEDCLRKGIPYYLWILRGNVNKIKAPILYYKLTAEILLGSTLLLRETLKERCHFDLARFPPPTE